DDRFLRKTGLANYWGYNSIGFFAPEERYDSGGGLPELKTMVKRLHDAGIEIVLDVVYNHTAEADHHGPTLCFRGIDNASYYHLRPSNRRYYDDTTGCGNSLNLGHPRVLQMVTDSLRYWVEEMHVDGFRYDRKHNEANGEGNHDGTNDNRSWNCGVEGPTDDPAVLALRTRLKRTLIATLLLSQGVPMLLAGDELGRTQAGNNNAYCQDNET